MHGAELNGVAGRPARGSARLGPTQGVERGCGAESARDARAGGGPGGLAPATRLGSFSVPMRFAFTALVSVALLPFSGCRKEEVTSYQVPKEQAPASGMPADHNHAGVAKGPAAAAAPASDGTTMANTPVATASGNALTWKGPAHWQDKGGSGMRKGTFTIAGEGGATAEMAITAFPGDVGGEVANVNRWRGQIQLPPQSPEEVGRSVQRLEQNGLKIGWVEMVGPGGSATRLLGAMVPHGGATWFFKLTGPDALVAKEKGAFLEFLKTIAPAPAK